jgi:hypothetical protein
MFHEIVGVELSWVQPKRSKSRFELRSGASVLATLTGHKKGRALGQWNEQHQEQRYWFSQEGWFRRRTIVRNAASNADDRFDANAEPLAMFVHQGSGGSLVFPDGRELTWKKPKRWTNARVWASATSELVRFQPANWHSRVTVMIQPEAAAQPEIPLLLLLGQDIHIRAMQDAEAAGVAASIVPVVAS